MSDLKFKNKTVCVHSGELKDLEYKGAVSPLYMSTSYAFEGVDSKRYPRYFNTPNQTSLAKRIAALEKGEKGLIFSSGMAAISSSLFSNLESGNHVIFQNDLYGGTRNFIKKQFPKYGIEFSFSKGLKFSDFQKEVKSNTVGIYIETPSNPLLKIINLKEISEFAKDKRFWTIIDNTFASPVNQNPINFGIDMVVHSATKYLGGHSDICSGAVVSSSFYINKIHDHAKNFGGSPSEFSTWLLERSVKTVFLRVEEQNKNAMNLAKFLQQNEFVLSVNYPGLESHPDHFIAKSQMHGGFGGILSFEINKNIDASKFLKALRLIKPTTSLGGVESTLIIPKSASHALLSDIERRDQGISDNLIRLSVGIEDIEDIKLDLINSLNFAADES
ncbi:MAG: PLP-dependent aspartate aminotransferase family protein [Bacteroidota bacterium]|nr:PLP-dependent aspartate aminotransferase family protein [Bacteroidota bacterium]